MATQTAIRPTKKQRELLTFIEQFITVHGYGPSYREIMNGCNYTSVATVALHVNGLISRGHLKKREKSARSLEIVKEQTSPALQTNVVNAAEERWLVDKIDYFFRQLENVPRPAEPKVDELYVLIGALKVLGLDGAAQAFLPRLSSLKQKQM